MIPSQVMSISNPPHGPILPELLHVEHVTGGERAQVLVTEVEHEDLREEADPGSDRGLPEAPLLGG